MDVQNHDQFTLHYHIDFDASLQTMETNKSLHKTLIMFRQQLSSCEANIIEIKTARASNQNRFTSKSRVQHKEPTLSTFNYYSTI